MEEFVKRNMFLFLFLFILGFLAGTFIPGIANQLTGYVTLGYCPDVNGDGLINSEDQLLIVKNINKTNCPPYNCDLDKNRIVTQEDARLVTINYGKYGYDITNCAAVFNYGALKITSNPSGSGIDVYVDNIKRSSSTPVTIFNLKAGMHNVRIVKSGYTDYVNTVNVQKGRLYQLNANLNIQQIACFADSNCQGGTTSPPFCTNDDLYAIYSTPRCLNPGTPSSYCRLANETRLVQDCQYGCSNGACIKPKTPPCDSYGDVDSNSYITQEDAELVSQFVAGLITFTDEQKRRADANGDAQATMVDAMLIAQYANGIITTFNVCSGPEICDGIDNDHNGQIDEGLSGCPSLFVEEKPLVVAEERYVCSLHNKTSGNGAFIKGQDGGTSITVGNMSYFPFGDTIYKDNPGTVPNIPNNIAYTNDPDASDCIFLNHKKTSGPETFFSTSDGSGNLVWSGYTPSSSGGVYQFFASDISCTDSSCFETAAEITYVSLVNLYSNYNYNLYICNPACSEDSDKEILPVTTDSSGVLTWSGTSPKSSGGKYQVFAADPSKNCSSSPCIESSSLLRRIDLKNLLADRNYKFTICNPNCTRDVPGKARSLFTAITGPPYNEITAWPGGMFSIEDGAVHFYYASVISWPEGPPGWQWKVQGVGLAKFNLSTLESKRIGTLLWDNSKPNVSVGAADAPIFVDNYLYVFIGIMPARVPKNQVENIDSYEYWTGGSWSKNISQGVPLWNEPTGTNSISIKYNNYLKKWLAMYGADYLTSVAVRTADQLTGPWSERVILLNCSIYQTGWPTCYTIWNHDQYSKNNGQTIYLVYSNIQDYRVFLHEAMLAVPIYQWMNYSNAAMYKRKGSSAPPDFNNYGIVFYASEYSSSDFSPIYEWHDTLAGRYRYSNSNPGVSYTNEGTAFYAPLSQLANYLPVYRWEKGITDIYSAKSGLESLGFTQKELAFYAKVS